ncbi:MAG: AtpZ/AtpI family protein [Planctomycetes bacterium]|nr:AtpZ/AtpI family protein [Planctomycetota bacterium]
MPEQQDANELLRFSHLGIQFVMVFGLFVALGFMADERLGTLPLLTVLGVMVGFGLAFYQLYVAVYGVRGGAGRGKGPDTPG